MLRACNPSIEIIPESICQLNRKDLLHISRKLFGWQSGYITNDELIKNISNHSLFLNKNVQEQLHTHYWYRWFDFEAFNKEFEDE